MSSIDENIRFIGRIAAECNHLSDYLKQELSTALEKIATTRRLKVAGKWTNSWRQDDSGWLTTDSAWSLPLIRNPVRGRSKPDAYLFFQLSLTGDGIEVSGNQQPLLHVGCWYAPINFRDDSWAGFPVSQPDDLELQLQQQYLHHWSDGQDHDEWSYAVYLLALNTPEDVRRLIIEPLMALLQRQNPASALPANHKGMVMLERDPENSTHEDHQFRVLTS